VKRFVIPAVLLLLICLQNSLFEYIKIFGVKPDIVLTFVICFTLIRGNPEGTIVGAAGGIVEDVFFGGSFGINSIACMISAYFTGLVEEKIYKDNIFIPGIFTFCATIVKEMIVFLFMYLTRASMDISIVFTHIIVPEAIYNTILAVIFFRYLVKINTRFFPDQTW
jgi:rod shape-determining protein MreD